MKVLSLWLPLTSTVTARNYLLSLLCLLLMKAGALLFALSYSSIGLGPEETQYWLWSRHLDLGYYSKPPGVAWEIALGTQVFGNTILGVRSGAMLLGLLLPLATYLLAGCCGLKPSTAFWAAVVMAISPLGVAGSFLATSDVGYVLFWTLACSVVALALRQGESPNYRLIGALIAFGALFKWPIYLFWVLFVPFSLSANKLRSKKMAEGMGISLLGLLPSFVWNARHDWVTFRHVWSTIKGGGADASEPVSLSFRHFFEFLGAQMALLSPVFFGLLLFALALFLKRRRRLGLPLFFCGYITLTVLGCYQFLSLFQKMQGNWCVYAYPTGVVLIAWYACEWLKDGKIYLFAGSVLSILLTVFVFSIPVIQTHDIASSFPIPYRSNPFRHNVGWQNLEKYLKAEGYEPQENFLVSDRYQTSSILSFYSEGQKRAYVLNLGRARKNQFSVWPSLADEQRGKSGFFVFVDERTITPLEQQALVAWLQEQLKDYFRDVQFLGAQPLAYAYGEDVKRALIFRCGYYGGRLPADPIRY